MRTLTLAQRDFGLVAFFNVICQLCSVDTFYATLLFRPARQTHLSSETEMLEEVH